MHNLKGLKDYIYIQGPQKSIFLFWEVSTRSSIELRHNAVFIIKRAKKNPVPLHAPWQWSSTWITFISVPLGWGTTPPARLHQPISLEGTNTSPSQNPSSSSSSSSLKTNSLSEQGAAFHILRQNKCKIKLETLQNRVGNANIDTAKRRECKAWLDRQSEYKIFHKNVIFI